MAEKEIQLDSSAVDLLDESSDAAPKKKKFKCEFPTAYTILFVLSIAIAICTYVIPAGSYDRKMNEELGKEVPVPGTYKQVCLEDGDEKGSCSTSFLVDMSPDLVCVLFVCASIFTLLHA
jgi:uncharacterized ion transporter superfamily protein YfcC